MNAAFIGPFAEALFAALQDDTHEGTANLLQLVYDDCVDDAPRIYPNRPEDPSESFVVIDYPFGGRDPAYVHGEDGDAVGHWSRFQASTWAQTKWESLKIMDALVQALDGRDIVVSDTWGSVRLFMRGAPWAQVDVISEVRMYGAGARYEILLLK